MKKHSCYKRWTIYYNEATDLYYGFLPGESPQAFFPSEWEGGSVQELKDFIDSYK